MALTEYQYSIANDTLNGAVYSDGLAQEIANSAIVTALERIDTAADVLSVWMKAALSGGDETILDGIVAAHDGVVPNVTQPVEVTNILNEQDKKVVVVQSPATDGWRTWFTGAGDQLSPLKRGDGDRLRISIAADGTDAKPCTKSAEIQFAEPVEIHDGQGQMRPTANFGLDDTADVYVRCPATVYSAGGGTGNANAIDLGGGVHMLVPAPGGDGDSLVDLADDAVPLMVESGGYWNADHETGAITPVTNPAEPDGNCNLLDQEIVAYVARRMPIGNELGILDIDVYKVEWVHPKWFIGLEVTKASSGAGEVAVWLLAFRRNTTES